jgi:UbiD family decarboxylase
VDKEVPAAAIPGLIQEEERNKNRAILFQKVQNHTVPVVANLYGTIERYALGVNTQTTNLWKKIEDAVAKPTPAVQASQAPCFEVVYNDPDITKILPVMQYSALDAGPYITSGVVFMKDPDTGRRNISFIRLMVKGPKKLGFNPKSLHNKA